MYTKNLYFLLLINNLNIKSMISGNENNYDIIASLNKELYKLRNGKKTIFTGVTYNTNEVEKELEKSGYRKSTQLLLSMLCGKQSGYETTLQILTHYMYKISKIYKENDTVKNFLKNLSNKSLTTKKMSKESSIFYINFLYEFFQIIKNEISKKEEPFQEVLKSFVEFLEENNISLENVEYVRRQQNSSNILNNYHNQYNHNPNNTDNTNPNNTDNKKEIPGILQDELRKFKEEESSIKEKEQTRLQEAEEKRMEEANRTKALGMHSLFLKIPDKRKSSYESFSENERSRDKNDRKKNI